MTPKNEWVWYGFAGHLSVSKRCAYHLCTRIGDRLVSTVGAFFPDRNSPMEPIGVSPDSYYETMVFECHGEDEHGNPARATEVLLVRYYADSLDAERGHREICERAARGEID